MEGLKKDRMKLYPQELVIDKLALSSSGACAASVLSRSSQLGCTPPFVLVYDARGEDAEAAGGPAHVGGAPHESGEVGVLLGSLAVLLVCLLGIRRSIVNEHRAYEEAQAAAKEQRALSGGSRRPFA